MLWLLCPRRVWAVYMTAFVCRGRLIHTVTCRDRDSEVRRPVLWLRELMRCSLRCRYAPERKGSAVWKEPNWPI
jgi:hypothetical protein